MAIEKVPYLRHYLPDHLRADVTGFVGEHILVMEEKLGRPTEKGEIIHHKTWFRLDNEPENLVLLTRDQHQQLPAMQGKFLLSRGLMDEFWAWWEEHKDEVDKLQEARTELAHIIMKKRRLKIRIARKEKRITDKNGINTELCK